MYLLDERKKGLHLYGTVFWQCNPSNESELRISPTQLRVSPLRSSRHDRLCTDLWEVVVFIHGVISSPHCLVHYPLSTVYRYFRINYSFTTRICDSTAPSVFSLIIVLFVIARLSAMILSEF